MGSLLRQGVFHTLNVFHVGRAARSAKATLEALVSQQSAEELQQALLNPTEAEAQVVARLREQTGLAIKPLDITQLRDREVVVRNNLIERYEAALKLRGKATGPRAAAVRLLAGYMRASERNMIVGLNVLRAETFDPMARQYLAGRLSLEDLAAWANYVNVTTGHGTAVIDSVRGAADMGNRLFFSARLLVSRPQTPFTLINTMRRNRTFARQVAKDTAGMLVTASAVAGLASLMGVDFEWRDPEDPDFLKMVWGNTRFDFLGGYGQATRLMLRLVGRTAEGREMGLGPGLTVPMQAIEGRDFLGRELGSGEGAERIVTSRAEALGQGLIPIFAQETAAAYKQEGALPALGTLGLSWIGVGVSTYDDPLRHQVVQRTLKRVGYRPGRPNDFTDAKWEAFRQQFAEVLIQGPNPDALTEEQVKELAADVRTAIRNGE